MNDHFDDTGRPLGRRRETGWTQPIELVENLSELAGPTEGVVHLPLRLYSSGLGPDRAFDLSDDGQRSELYEIVLTRGTAEDQRHYINAEDLLRLWRHLWLPGSLRAAWEQRLPPQAA